MLGDMEGVEMRVAQARTLATYNHWMNERIYDVCASLPDAERKKDRGAFFRSIHGTLNHLLLGDRIWLSRFKQEFFHVTSLDQELYSDFEELRYERRKTDIEIIQWVESLTDEMLLAELQYTSIVNPKRRRCPVWVAVTHFFNHQTHHRGQLTTLLSQCGCNYGVIDLIWLPGLVEENIT
jgi:uncharacterized damage-inducible protein DinB